MKEHASGPALTRDDKAGCAEREGKLQNNMSTCWGTDTPFTAHTSKHKRCHRPPSLTNLSTTPPKNTRTMRVKNISPHRASPLPVLSTAMPAPQLLPIEIFSGCWSPSKKLDQLMPT